MEASGNMGCGGAVFVVDVGVQCLLVVVQLEAPVPPALRVRHPRSGERVQGRGPRRVAAQGAGEGAPQRPLAFVLWRQRHVQAHGVVE
jgi:hypothetical protein